MLPLLIEIPGIGTTAASAYVVFIEQMRRMLGLFCCGLYRTFDTAGMGIELFPKIFLRAPTGMHATSGYFEFLTALRASSGARQDAEILYVLKSRLCHGASVPQLDL